MKRKYVQQFLMVLRKKKLVNLPYEPDFKNKSSRPIQMNQELLELWKNEIQKLLDKN